MITGILLVACLLFIFARKFTSFMGNSSQSSIISKLQRNPARGTELAEQLDIPLERRENISAEAARLLLQKLAQTKTIDKYVVRFALAIDADQLLMLTSIEYTDLDYGLTGRHVDLKDVKKTAYHDFLLRYNSTSQGFQVNSDLFETTDSKFQKHEFAKTILRLLEAVPA